MAINLPNISETLAGTLRDGVQDDGSGVDYIAHLIDDDDDPKLKTRIIQQMYQVSRAIAAMNEGCVWDKTPEGAGLTVIVRRVPRYQLGGVLYDGHVDEEFVCADDDTCYLYLDDDEVVEQNSGAWPGAAHFKLAVVTTAAGTITSIVPAIKENFDPDGEAQWYNVAAAANVDMAGFDLNDVGLLEFQAQTNLTINAGSVTPTQTYHQLSGEGGAADDLVTITADAAKVGQIVMFDIQHEITVKDGTGNISTPHPGIDLLATAASQRAVVAFVQHSATNWRVLFDSQSFLAALTADVDAATYGFYALGRVGVELLTQTISGGTLAYTGVLQHINTEGGAASDDLDTITAGTLGDLLIIIPFHTDRTVVVKHSGAASGFKLQNGLDFTMDTTEHILVCLREGAFWVEISRSPITARSLVSTAVADRCIPYSPGTFEVAGALAVQVYPKQIYCPVAFTIHDVTGRLTAAGVPAGVPCIVDVRVDGASIFVNQAEMVNIAIAAQEDTSATKDHAVAAGSYIDIECEQTGGADDLTVAINGYVGITAKP